MDNFDRYQDAVSVARYITLQGQYEGFHAYENAPEEVAFLRVSHRHLFKYKIVIEVEHDDRELEFFMVQMYLEREVFPFTNMLANLGSCEMQAERHLRGLLNKYGIHRYYSVTVSEDGENGGTVEWDPRS